MTYRSYNPEQRVCFPAVMSDSLPENHLMLFVLDLVSKLDLSAIHGVYEQRKGGQPPYHPAMMIGLLLRGAEATDAAEDSLYGKGVRGDELPAELSRREKRLAKIRQ